MTAADANGTALGGTRGCKGSREVGAEGMEEDSRAHAEGIIQQLHKSRAVGKRDAPGVRVWDIDHGRHHVFGFHATFCDGFAGNCNVAELGAGGHAVAISKPSLKFTLAGRQGGG